MRSLGGKKKISERGGKKIRGGGKKGRRKKGGQIKEGRRKKGSEGMIKKV